MTIPPEAIFTTRYITTDSLQRCLPKPLGSQLEQTLCEENLRPGRLVLIPIPVFLDELHNKLGTCSLVMALHDLLLPLPEDIEIGHY